MALLDYKVSIGYDFDQTHEEDDERRVADTYRVISLSFSNLGGPDAVQEYYSTFGNRSYEDRVYSNLGEHYLDKLRYDDAAKTYKAFVALYPFHRAAPRFSMRVVETFTQGGFPKLVLESKREFASRYGLKAEYWRHFKPEESPEVLAYLKTNLKDLATHYHAEYQSADEGGREARELSRGAADGTATISSRSRRMPIRRRSTTSSRTCCSRTRISAKRRNSTSARPTNTRRTPQSAAAGYAAVYAYREQLKVAGRRSSRTRVKRDTVASSLKFADAFPQHEHAAAVLGAAADDMYEMKDYRAAIDVRPARHRYLSGRGRRPSGAPRGLSLRTARSNSPSTRRPSTPTPRCWRSRRRATSRAPRSSTTSPPRSTSRVKPQTRRRTIARPPTTS